VPSPLEQRVRELCALVAATTGAEQDLAFAELRSALTALIHEVENISKYNLLHFPAALEKRKIN
jgi:hypothetical protein